jgi:hypothetical protein
MLLLDSVSVMRQATKVVPQAAREEIDV